MEPDISILRKTGHFYFALTACLPGRFTAVAASLRSRSHDWQRSGRQRRAGLRHSAHTGKKAALTHSRFELLFRWMEFLPIRPSIAAAFDRSARQRRTMRPRLGAAPRYGARLPRQARLQIASRRIIK